MKQNDPETYSIIGAAMAVHGEIGPGLMEAVYQEALEIQFQDDEVPYLREKRLNIFFKDRILKKYYQADFLCFNNIIVEIKAQRALTDIDHLQIINYLKVTKMKRGLLINFGAKSLETKRFVN